MKASEQIPQIGLVGINHKTAPVEIRENFSLDEEAINEIFDSSVKMGIKEIVCLSTCNRVEIYFTSNDIQRSSEALTLLLKKKSSVSKRELNSYLYKINNRDAVTHLLKVAASLDSMVVGENEILGQVKDAYRKSTSRKKTGPVLNRLFHQAFKSAKRIKTETGISKNPLSVAYIAVELVRDLFKDISGRKALMIGAGEMGGLILKYFTKYKMKEITIANRTYHNAQKIADEIDAPKCSIIKLEEISNMAGQFDIIISSVAVQDFILTKETAGSILTIRGDDPLFIIDIAVPRSVDPGLAEKNGILLYNIDDLQSIADENLKNRLKEVELADNLIESDTQEFYEWYLGLDAVPVIKSIRDKFNKIRMDELKRYRGTRLKHLKKEDLKIIENLTGQIMKKILHDPIIYLKNSYKNETKDIRRIIENIFGIE